MNNSLKKLYEESNKYPKQRTPEWLALKKSGTFFGGTDISKIRKGKAVYPHEYSNLIKTKASGINTFKGNMYTRWGNYYEKMAILRYEEEERCKVHEMNMFKHQEYEFLIYSPDGVAEYPNGDIVLIEVKCPYKREIKGDSIPPDYYDQIQLGLEILNSYGIRTFCHFIQFKPLERNDNEEILSIQKIDYDDRWIHKIIPNALITLEHIKEYKAKIERGESDIPNDDLISD